MRQTMCYYGSDRNSIDLKLLRQAPFCVCVCVYIFQNYWNLFKGSKADLCTIIKNGKGVASMQYLK